MGGASEHQAVLDARQKLSNAQREAGRSSAQLLTLTSTKRQEFNASPEMVAATAAHKSAQSAYDGAKAQVRASLRTRPEYLAAVAADDQTRQKLKELQESGARPEQITAAAEAGLVAESTVNKMENAAFDADATAREAKTTASVAAANLAGLRRKVEEGLKADADLAAAKAGLDTATAALKTAQAELRDKIKAESVTLASRPVPQSYGPSIFTGGNTGYINGATFTPGARGANVTTGVIPYGAQLGVTTSMH